MVLGAVSLFPEILDATRVKAIPVPMYTRLSHSEQIQKHLMVMVSSRGYVVIEQEHEKESERVLFQKRENCKTYLTHTEHSKHAKHSKDSEHSEHSKHSKATVDRHGSSHSRKHREQNTTPKLEQDHSAEEQKIDLVSQPQKSVGLKIDQQHWDGVQGLGKIEGETMEYEDLGSQQLDSSAF